jgi:hypothetical protein
LRIDAATGHHPRRHLRDSWCHQARDGTRRLRGHQPGAASLCLRKRTAGRPCRFGLLEGVIHVGKLCLAIALLLAALAGLILANAPYHPARAASIERGMSASCKIRRRAPQRDDHDDVDPNCSALVESLDYVHLFIPAHTSFPELASTVSRSRARALLGQYFIVLSELVDAGQRALCIAEIRNPVAAVQTQPRRLPTSAPTARELFDRGLSTPISCIVA